MRIAFISTICNFHWGGADTLWTRAAEAAVARGDDVLLGITPQVAGHPRVAAILARGARLVARPPSSPSGFAERLRRRSARLFGAREPLLRSLGEFAPEVIVVSGASAYDFVAERPLYDAMRKSGATVRIVTNFQKENPELSDRDRRHMAEVFAHAGAVFFVSRRNLEVTRRHLLSPVRNGELIQNPLRPARGALPWPKSPPWRLATVGRIDHVKGVPLVVHALAALGPERDWRLDVFGSGHEIDYVRETAAALGVADRVQLRGWVDDLDAIWADHHLLVSAALDEGVPMVIPEAMLRGRPVLATCVGGAEDWITHGQDGFLCPAPTLPLLTPALREAWDARERWRDLGVAANAAASAMYRPNDYERLLAPAAPRPSP